jgi:hypothetical protein
MVGRGRAIMADGTFEPSAVSDGVIAYLGWGINKRPKAHGDRVIALAPPGLGEELLREVYAAIEVSESVTASSDDIYAAGVADDIKRRIGERLPGLSDEAIHALGS